MVAVPAGTDLGTSLLSRIDRITRIARLLVALGDEPAVAVARGRRLVGRAADGPRGERLAIQDHRERAADGGDRLHESWVLRRVLGWSERDAARALDCSRTVLRRHLEAIPDRSPEAETAEIETVRRRMQEVVVADAPGWAAFSRGGRRWLAWGGLAAVLLAGLAIIVGRLG